jgi:penicillin amidase/acyl-homoserine-lactone acylase
LRRVLAVAADEPRLSEAQTVLQRWNLATDKNNREAALGVCILKAEWNAEARGLPLPDPKDTLAICVDELDDMTGSLTPTWGSVNRHGRDDIHYPMAGGPDTLRASYATADEAGDFNRVTAGDGLYYLVRWDAKGEQSILGVHQYGNHFDDPENPHYHDQAKDFTDEVLHPALFQRAARESLVKRSYRIISGATPQP